MEKSYAGDSADDNGGSKEHRERTKTFGTRNKKQMYIKLKNQMEFYLSASNISRDKFVGKLLEEDSQIPVSTFLTFNKVKEIFNNFMIPEEKRQNELVKSLSKSEMISVTDDGNKVYLKNGILKKTQQEIDELTIYVEQIPLTSTHDSIKSIFSKYGKINYISLPRYKKSGQLKQFCFIEFDDPSQVQNVLQDFKKIDALLLHQSIKPENLLSIKTFERDSDNEQEPPAKKAKLEEPDSVPENAADEKEEEKASTEKDETATDKSEENKEDESEKNTEDAPRKKKLRKHKRNHSKKKLLNDEHIMAMKIMKKSDWKKLRNTYLTLERQKAKEIKKILRESYNKRNENKNQILLATSKESPKISFYGSPDHSQTVDPATSFESCQDNIQSFTQGCIVNIKFREPCAEPKEFKKELKQFSSVQYVDIQDSTQCFIRVDTSQAAHELVNHYSSCEYETEILKDDAEKDYWKKIFENREKKKRSKDTEKQQHPVEKRKRRRGREKLAIKISKATQSNQIIRFSEFDD